MWEWNILDSANFCFSKHRKTHFREPRTFMCSYCSEVFSHKKDMKRHERSIHNLVANFPCQFPPCQRALRGFTRKDKRDEHEKKMHGTAQKYVVNLESDSLQACNSDLDRQVTSQGRNRRANYSYSKDETIPRIKEHKCTHAQCTREQGFGSPHDLQRHQRTKHPASFQSPWPPGYFCMAETCNRTKLWPRLDNLRQHIAKIHPSEDVNALITELVRNLSD